MWKRSNMAFQATLNRMRREGQQAAEMRLERLIEAAIAALEQAVSQGDLKAALAVIHGHGMLSGGTTRIGSDEAEVLEREAQIEAQHGRRSTRAVGARCEPAIRRPLEPNVLDAGPATKGSELHRVQLSGLDLG